MWFRFGYASDMSGVWEGAYVDNVRLEVLGPDHVFADGFESGDTDAWSVTVP